MSSIPGGSSCLLNPVGAFSSFHPRRLTIIRKMIPFFPSFNSPLFGFFSNWIMLSFFLFYPQVVGHMELHLLKTLQRPSASGEGRWVHSPLGFLQRLLTSGGLGMAGALHVATPFRRPWSQDCVHIAVGKEQPHFSCNVF